MGAVGLDWKPLAFGNFSSRSEKQPGDPEPTQAVTIARSRGEPSGVGRRALKDRLD
jgi:hypothetical protein